MGGFLVTWIAGQNEAAGSMPAASYAPGCRKIGSPTLIMPLAWGVP